MIILSLFYLFFLVDLLYYFGSLKSWLFLLLRRSKMKRKKISRKASRENFSRHSLSAPINYAPALTRGGFRI